MGLVPVQPERSASQLGAMTGAFLSTTSWLALLTLMMAGGLMAASDFDQVHAARFAKMALDCVHLERPPIRQLSKNIKHSFYSVYAVSEAYPASTRRRPAYGRTQPTNRIIYKER